MTSLGSSRGQGTKNQKKVEFEHIEKRFGRVTALKDVSLDVYDNEIFAIVGDNGAGKSTLMKILCGVHKPTSGQLYLDGEQVEFGSPNEARQKGIETVYQDFALMDDLDIASNVFMGQFPTRGIGPIRWVDWEATYENTERILREELGREMNVREEVQFLSGGQRQLVAIARALAFDPDIIILDEPTSSLSIEATELVYDIIRQLKRKGRTVFLISHSVREVLTLADRIGVLYQGKVAEIAEAEELDEDSATELITTGA